jgi:hypothetical protein
MIEEVEELESNAKRSAFPTRNVSPFHGREIGLK